MLKKIAFVTAIAGTLVACESFTEVVIPAVDGGVPTALATIFEDGQHIVANDRVSNDPADSYTIVASAMDGGGAHRVTLYMSGKVSCDIGGGLSSTSYLDYAPEHVIVDAKVGDKVMNGLYIVDVVSPGKSHCAQGDLSRAEFTWSVEGEDFHGNIDWTDGGSLIYER